MRVGRPDQFRRPNDFLERYGPRRAEPGPQALKRVLSSVPEGQLDMMPEPWGVRRRAARSADELNASYRGKLRILKGIEPGLISRLP
jgi:hypothetical protein